MTKPQQDLCEACKKTPCTIVEGYDCSISPYYLCDKCHKRLKTLTLRPIEWYNLSVIHGWSKYYLNSDFYDEKGIASQPKELFSISKEDYAPQLQDVVSNLISLIEYCTTRWWIDEELIKELYKHDSEKLLSICQQKYEASKSLHNKSTLIEIVGLVTGTLAAPWVRELWQKEEIDYVTLSQASIRTLPLEEAFHLITTYLKTVTIRELPDKAFVCLHLFRSPLVLDWMETRVNEYRDSWARLVAASNPTWAYLHKWILKGRPLSLVAIEAIANCIPRTGDPYLAKLKPRIKEVPSQNIVKQVLLEYERSDNVPRVDTAVAYILSHTDKIFREENYG